jgi:16S rRNA G966 N2-methylase RsmD
LVERHFPTAAVIEKNAKALGIAERCTVLTANTLLWAKRLPDLPAAPWVVFCSPPYELYVSHIAEMLALVGQLLRSAPQGSMFAVEADERFDFRQLPRADQWDVREYPPAIVGILRIENERMRDGE